MTPPARFGFIALVLALGCGSEEDDDGQGEDTSGATTTATTSATSGATMTSTSGATTTATTSASTSATTTAETTDDGPATTEDDGPAPTTDDGAPTTEADGGAICEIGPDDDACRECVKMACCDVWTQCMNDDVCACTIDCHLAGASLGSCKNECGGDSELYEAVFFCGQQTCLGTCDWDCC
jgi:hypothetical protein